MTLSVVQPRPANDGPGAALKARYGFDTPAISEVWSDTLGGLLQHRSVRAYLPDALAPGTLEAIIAAAQSAASSSNQQFWSVVAVENSDRKARLAELAGGQAHIRQAPLFLIWLADLNRATAIAELAGQGHEALDYIESLVVSVVDAALAAQNAVVALESLGLGSVYIGAIRNRPEAVAEELGLPPLVLPVFGLCVGRIDPARPAEVKPRLPQAAVLHRETYSTEQHAPVAAYDETLRDFQRSQALPPTGWTQAVVSRVSKVAALNGRERLREALQGFGFRLR
jgi:nitroreductase